MDPDVQLMLGYVAHYLAGGETLAYAMSESVRRLGIPGARGRQVTDTVRALVRRGLQFAEMATLLQDDEPLSTVLRGYTPPAATVAVRIIFEAADGDIASKVINATWDMTIGQIRQLALEQIESDSGPAPKWATADWFIRGPMIAPSPNG